MTWTTVELTDKKITDKPAQDARYDQNKLFFVPVPDKHKRLNGNPTTRCFRFHQKATELFGTRLPVSWSKMEKVAQTMGMGPEQLRPVISYLWGNGFVDKYAKGLFEAGKYGNTEGWKNGSGKHFGVHYKFNKVDYTWYLPT